MGGGGDETQPESDTSTGAITENNFLPLLKDNSSDDDSIPAGKTKEYDITGFSVTYVLDKSKVDGLKIPKKDGSEFTSWKIYDINSALSTAEGPAKGTAIIPSELSYTLTYMLKKGDPLEFPAASLLKANNSAYITVSAEFKLDEYTDEAIKSVEALINSIQDQLDAGKTSDVEAPKYTDENLVGATMTGGAVEDLDKAVKAARAAINGKEVDITVPLDDFERDDQTGEYKIDAITGEMIPLVVHVKYRVYDMAEIDAAKKDLEAAIAAAIEAELQTYIPDTVALSSKEEGDKNWKSVTIVDTGVYKITISGASGGHAVSSNNTMEFGGSGGYVEAQKQFNAGDVLKIRIGTEGKGMAKLNAAKTGLELDSSISITTAPPGGWPNGGAGGKRSGDSYPGSGGGGATEVYAAGSRESGGGNLKEPDALVRKNDLLLVAGGGGGAGPVAKATNISGVPRASLPGGNAGEKPVPAMYRGPQWQTTAQYTLGEALLEPYTYITATTYDRIKKNGYGHWYGEYAPNDDVAYDAGKTGQGVSGSNGGGGLAWEACGGGGGGYVGGNAIKIDRSGGSGGGGSNHIADEFSKVEGKFKNETASTYGNGAFKIEYAGSGQ